MADFIERKHLSPDQAELIAEAGIERAKQLGISGLLVVKDRAGFLLNSKAVGANYKPTYEILAHAKVDTVVNNQRSTSLQDARLYNEDPLENRIVPDFAGAVLTRIHGGVAAFADLTKQEFVGAVGFSGGTPDQDTSVSRVSLWRAGIFTDLGLTTQFIESVSHPSVVQLLEDMQVVPDRLCFSCGTSLIDHNQGLCYKATQPAIDCFEAGNAKFTPLKEDALLLSTCYRHDGDLRILHQDLTAYKQLIPEMVEFAVNLPPF